MVKKQQLTPIPAHIQIKRLPPGRALWAGLPGEFVGGSDRNRETRVDTYYLMTHSF